MRWSVRTQLLMPVAGLLLCLVSAAIGAVVAAVQSTGGADGFPSVARPLMGLGLGCGLAAAVWTLVVARRLTGRIRQLQRAVGRIANGGLRPVPLAGHNDELRDLGRSVNELVERLSHWQNS